VLQRFYGKWSHPLLRAGSRAARGKIAATGIPNHLNFSVIFVLCTRFTIAAVGRGLNTHDLNIWVTAYSVNVWYTSLYIKHCLQSIVFMPYTYHVRCAIIVWRSRAQFQFRHRFWGYIISDKCSSLLLIFMSLEMEPRAFLTFKLVPSSYRRIAG
jgi:hypothetical protein